MTKKSNKKLLLLLGVLIAITALVFLLDQGSDRSFKDYISKTDSAKIETITINKGDVELLFQRDGNAWSVSSEGKIHKADPKVVKTVLGYLSELKSERVVSQDPRKQEHYQVDDLDGLHLSAKNSEQTVSDFYVGRFDYKQTDGQNANGQPNYKATSYVREAGDKTIYAVDGFLKMSIPTKASNSIYKNLVDLKPNQIQAVEFTMPADSSFSLALKDGRWTVDNQPADSTACVNYIKRLSRLMSGDFVDTDVSSRQATFIVSITGENFSPITINGYGDGINELLVTSTNNPGEVWDALKNRASLPLFPSQKELVK